jgi:UDP-N-acetylmuramoylalanine--D-glutamate ligase
LEKNKDTKKVLIDNNIEWEEEGHKRFNSQCNVVMKSPGILIKRPLSKLVEKGIAVISEIEFAALSLKAVTIG